MGPTSKGIKGGEGMGGRAGERKEMRKGIGDGRRPEGGKGGEGKNGRHPRFLPGLTPLSTTVAGR